MLQGEYMNEPKRRAKKRGHGEGSIFQRGDGRWVATIVVGYSATWKRLRRTIYGATKREVTMELTRLQNQKLDGQLLVRERLTVAELIDRWLTHWSPKLAESTRLRYRQIAIRYILPNVGGIVVEKLQPIHVRGLLDKLAADGVGDRSRQYVFATLRRAFTLALRLDLTAINPCSRVESPQAKVKPVNAPDAAMLSKLIEKAADDPYAALFVLAITTGLRQGELFALAWEDLDLAKRTLTVRHSLEEVQGRLALKEPKSASGRRMVKLPSTAVDALLDHRKRLVAAGKDGNPFIFTDADGGFLRKSNFQRRVWGPLLKAAGLEGLRFHDLRHGHASILLRQSVHPKIVQERLGHSTIKLTMDTYSHLMPDAQDAAADATDRVFSANGCQLAVKSDRAENAGDDGLSQVVT